MKILFLLVLFLLSPQQSTQPIVGEWIAKKEVRLTISGQTTSYELELFITFDGDGNFTTTTGNSLIDGFIKGYLEEQGLDYDSYKFSNDERSDILMTKKGEESQMATYKIEWLNKDKIKLHFNKADGTPESAILKRKF